MFTLSELQNLYNGNVNIAEVEENQKDNKET